LIPGAELVIDAERTVERTLVGSPDAVVERDPQAGDVSIRSQPKASNR
jgi:hypothetical protein